MASARARFGLARVDVERAERTTWCPIVKDVLTLNRRYLERVLIDQSANPFVRRPYSSKIRAAAVSPVRGD